MEEAVAPMPETGGRAGPLWLRPQFGGVCRSPLLPEKPRNPPSPSPGPSPLRTSGDRAPRPRRTQVPPRAAAVIRERTSADAPPAARRPSLENRAEALSEVGTGP
ncbi:hypothetical protein SKAU_G00335750 [Synaphobranchus kaupii]|uniref:Uncharacterized protein n=1 Tax=Synaphobranchus kaupii TaxID=118154 RepID=A0A9Q1ELY5_SYNKA|nr:hypothetical protein SKAU_G00335750 [Synaphobranchus kaupii]